MSKIANWGNNLLKTLGDAIFNMHRHIVPIDDWNCKILPSDVIRGHSKSKTSMSPKLTSNDLWGQTHILALFLSHIWV